ncbi:hypothetical protein Poli38472_010307 [Pythium oligandrum]|uniref:Carbonic anhydrase n=1 Tax=Pythium oligandrum TaxID=41045 RepID=A0A8K1F9P0_PYTOL|nr:hypothetical protein Poli38472_010307 [Pythium oligandrum]|eukprot:TMW55425.1 hypothetical protein Poli38472_010307 [Pythium oligandrum]
MKLFTAVYATIACLFVSSTCAASTINEGWSYRTNDPVTHGPADWGAEFPVCAGSRQSPIDITQRDACGEEKRRAPLSFAGECSNFHIKQLYESYKAEIANGSCTVLAKNKSYNFAQVHFHAPSEHTLNGKTFDGEVHFVHQAADGNILVVGLFLTKKQGATTDPFVAKFWWALQQVSTTNPVDVALGSYASLLKSKTSKGHAYNYPGSLTTPGCSETVDWWVLERALPVAAADFASFQTSLARIGAAANGTNARPIQALNGRSIIVY